MPARAASSLRIDHVLYDRTAKDPTDPLKTYNYNWFDMLRIDNGQIQEHWDTARKAPPQDGR